MVMCSSASARMTLSTSPVSSGSSAEVGSSKNSARAMATRCCWPPESWLLAAGELARIGVGLVAEAHLLERLARGRLDLRAVALLHADGRIHNVFEYRVVREEIELLKNEAEIVADLLELRLVGVDGGAVVARARGVVPVKADLAASMRSCSCGAAQQRGFAAAARADDGHDLALFDA